VAVEEPYLQRDDGSVLLTEVAAGTRFDDEHLDPVLDVESPDLRQRRDGKRAFRPPDGSLAVGDDRQVLVRPREPPSGAQLGERLGIVAGAISGEAGGLTDDADPGGKSTRPEGLLPRSLRVLVDEPADHDEVPGHLLRGVGAQPGQPGPHVTIELRPGDLLGDERTLRNRPARRPVLLHTRRCSRVAGTGPLTALVRTPRAPTGGIHPAEAGPAVPRTGPDAAAWAGGRRTSGAGSTAGPRTGPALPTRSTARCRAALTRLALTGPALTGPGAGRPAPQRTGSATRPRTGSALPAGGPTRSRPGNAAPALIGPAT
jgi:hypothetical protein